MTGFSTAFWPAPNWSGFPARKAEAAERGKLRGIGLSCYIEACGVAPSSAVGGALGCGVGMWEMAEIKVNPVGTVEVFVGTLGHGQGHETTYAQIAADRFGIPIESISVIEGDTDKVQQGMGSYGSRTAGNGTAAVSKALDKVEAKAKKIAAHLLEASETDIKIENGDFIIAGTNKKLTLTEVALAAYSFHKLPKDLEPGLDEKAYFDPIEPDLSRRRLRLRGRGRSGDRHRPRSSSSPRSMISAMSSTR